MLSNLSGLNLIASEDGLLMLRDRLRKFADDRNWGQFHNPKSLAALAVSLV
jgi:hypothetical protein